MSRTNIRKPLCLEDKPIVETLGDLDKGYGLNYMGAPGFPKMKSHIEI